VEHLLKRYLIFQFLVVLQVQLDQQVQTHLLQLAQQQSVPLLLPRVLSDTTLRKIVLKGIAEALG
jgi:hypothetical protein